MVFFTLMESTAETRRKLLAACSQYLSDHPGTVYFGAGIRTEDLQRPVNDRTFDVGLHLIFATRADHDRYQTSPRHQQFIAENKDTWKEVRVFDSDVG